MVFYWIDRILTRRSPTFVFFRRLPLLGCLAVANPWEHHCRISGVKLGSEILRVSWRFETLSPTRSENYIDYILIYSMGRISQWEPHIMENKKCSKPPTRYWFIHLQLSKFEFQALKDQRSWILNSSSNHQPSLRLYKCLRSRRFRFFHLDLFRGWRRDPQHPWIKHNSYSDIWWLQQCYSW